MNGKGRAAAVARTSAGKIGSPPLTKKRSFEKEEDGREK